MSSLVRRRRLLGSVVDFLVEPLEAPSAPPPPIGAPSRRAPLRPVVAVAGLARGCGTTTVARALGAELALRDPTAATVVAAASVPATGVPLGTAAAGRLARGLARALAVDVRAVGRLCLAECPATDAAALVTAARPLAPVVLDVADPADVAVAAALADAVVLVGSRRVEPALGEVVGASLARVGPAPLVVLNRDRESGGAVDRERQTGGEGDRASAGEDRPGTSDRWRERHSVALPDSRVGAQLATAGREPRGELGRAVAALADLLARESW